MRGRSSRQAFIFGDKVSMNARSKGVEAVAAQQGTHRILGHLVGRQAEVAGERFAISGDRRVRCASHGWLSALAD